MKHILYNTEYFVDGCIRWQCTIENGELPLEALWYVIPTSTRMDHSSNKLHISYISKVPWFVHWIETSHLHALPDNLIGDLQNSVLENLCKKNTCIKIIT